MHKESRICPQEFQDRLRVFGQNPYGENLYKFCWGRTSFILMGNIWRDTFGNERREYRPRCQNNEMQCWTLMRWKPSEFYGSPASYYAKTWDSVSKLFQTGEYPWRGRYELVQAFMEKTYEPGKDTVESVPAERMVDGKIVIEQVTVKYRTAPKLVIEHMELTHLLIDRIIPMIEAFQRLTLEEKQAAQEFEANEEKRREAEESSAKFEENLPVWINPVSYSGQGCRTSLLDKKMEKIQAQWNRMKIKDTLPNFQKGFQVGAAPRVN